MIEHYDELLPKLERHIRACAKGHDRKSFALLRSIHGADLIIPLVILYEVHDIARFPRVQEFLSYCRWSSPLASRPARSRDTRGARSATPI